MPELHFLLSLAGYSIGTIGAVFIFIELFQTPSYVEYNRSRDRWSVTYSPEDADEYTWIGRIGALLMALAFGLLFLATFVEFM